MAIALELGRTFGPYNGPGFLSGSATVASIPAQRWIYILERSNTALVATVFSAADGAWRVDGLDPGRAFNISIRDLPPEVYKDQSENTVHPWPFVGPPPPYPHGDYVPPDGNDVRLNLDLFVPARSVIPFAVWAS